MRRTEPDRLGERDNSALHQPELLWELPRVAGSRETKPPEVVPKSSRLVVLRPFPIAEPIRHFL